MASSLQQPFFLSWLTVHAMAFVQTFLQRPLQHVPNCQNNLPTTAIFFSDEKVKDGQEIWSLWHAVPNRKYNTFLHEPVLEHTLKHAIFIIDIHV